MSSPPGFRGLPPGLAASAGRHSAQTFGQSNVTRPDSRLRRCPTYPAYVPLLHGKPATTILIYRLYSALGFIWKPRFPAHNFVSAGQTGWVMVNWIAHGRDSHRSVE